MRTPSLLLLSSVLLFAGCASHPRTGDVADPGASASASAPAPTPPAPQAPTPAAPAEVKEVKVGDRVRCPVSGDEFTVEADSLRVEHAGRTYYVCCEGCLEDFKANPEKYTHAHP